MLSLSPLTLFTDHIRNVGQFFVKEADKCSWRTKLGELGEKLFFDGKNVGGAAVITNTAAVSQCTSTIMCIKDEHHAATQQLRHCEADWRTCHKYLQQSM